MSIALKISKDNYFYDTLRMIKIEMEEADETNLFFICNKK
mgnify:CR=1 FL=1